MQYVGDGGNAQNDEADRLLGGKHGASEDDVQTEGNDDYPGRQDSGNGNASVDDRGVAVTGTSSQALAQAQSQVGDFSPCAMVFTADTPLQEKIVVARQTSRRNNDSPSSIAPRANSVADELAILQRWESTLPPSERANLTLFRQIKGAKILTDVELVRIRLFAFRMYRRVTEKSDWVSCFVTLSVTGR